MGFGSKIVVGEVWLLVGFKVIYRRNQLNEWFASFEKAPSGFRFHIYYFKPFQLDPWGFPGLPGGVFFFQASLPFLGQMFVFLTYSSQPPTTPPSESPGQPLLDMGAWCLVGEPSAGSSAWQAASCPMPAFAMESQGRVLAHWRSLLEALRFERKRDFLMGFPLQEYQSAPEKH